MAITDIDWGTVTLTNGSTTVTGSGTSWIADDIRDGDTFVFVDGGDGFQQPIVASVQSNTELTLRNEWEGPTLTATAYTLRYQWDSSRVSAMSRRLIMILDNGNVEAFAALTGPGVAVFNGPHSMEVRPFSDFVNGARFDVQVDTLSDRDAYDGQTQGFAVLVSDVGDGRSALYSKNTNTSGDWSDAAYITGPVGPLPEVEATVSMLPPGTPATVTEVPITGGVRLDFELPEASGFYNAGVYDIGEAYDQDDVVRHNGSSFIALQAVPVGESPSNVSPPVDTAYWQVLAAKGQDGDIDGVTPFWQLRILNDADEGDALTGLGVTPFWQERISADTDAAAARAGLGIADFVSPQGRLTLTSGIALPSSDVTGATAIYYVPNSGPSVPLFDGVAFTSKKLAAQLLLDLDNNSAHAGYHQAARNFDLFVINDAGTLRLGSGPSWNAGAVAGSDVARGTGSGSTELEVVSGLLVNKNAITIRFGVASSDTVEVAARQATYLGSFRTVANGQAADTQGKRFLFNAFNRAARPLHIKDNTASHTYSVNAYRYYNDNSANAVELLLGLDGVLVDIAAYAYGTNSTATPRNLWAGIGLDGVTIPSGEINGAISTVTGQIGVAQAKYVGNPGLGFHRLTFLQRGSGADTQSWLGTAGLFDPGLTGTVIV